jgi:hypothetical protein
MSVSSITTFREMPEIDKVLWQQYVTIIQGYYLRPAGDICHLRQVL